VRGLTVDEVEEVLGAMLAARRTGGAPPGE
jgi:hypothetical protein